MGIGGENKNGHNREKEKARIQRTRVLELKFRV
jgi:hypothetical protein